MWGFEHLEVGDIVILYTLVRGIVRIKEDYTKKSEIKKRLDVARNQINEMIETRRCFFGNQDKDRIVWKIGANPKEIADLEHTKYSVAKIRKTIEDEKKNLAETRRKLAAVSEVGVSDSHEPDPEKRTAGFLHLYNLCKVLITGIAALELLEKFEAIRDEHQDAHKKICGVFYSMDSLAASSTKKLAVHRDQWRNEAFTRIYFVDSTEKTDEFTEIVKFAYWSESKMYSWGKKIKYFNTLGVCQIEVDPEWKEALYAKYYVAANAELKTITQQKEAAEGKSD